MSDVLNNKRILLQIVDKIQLEIEFSNVKATYWLWQEKDRWYITNTNVRNKKEIHYSVANEILSFFDKEELERNLANTAMHISFYVFNERYLNNCLDSKNIASFYETVVLRYRKK